LLKSVKELEKLSSTPLDKCPTYAPTLSKCTENEGTVCYQLQKLKQFENAISYFASNYKAYCTKVKSYMKSRLTWSDV